MGSKPEEILALLTRHGRTTESYSWTSGRAAPPRDGDALVAGGRRPLPRARHPAPRRRHTATTAPGGFPAVISSSGEERRRRERCRRRALSRRRRVVGPWWTPVPRQPVSR